MYEEKMSTQSVILVANYRPDRQESMLKFGSALYSGLLAAGYCVSLWEPPRLLARIALWTPGKLGKWLGYIDKLVLGSIGLLATRICHQRAIWHITDHSNAVYAWLLPTKRLVVTCHDCIAIDDALNGRTGQRIGWFGPLMQRWIAAGLRRARVVACDTKATAADLERLVHPKPGRTRLVLVGMVQQLDVPVGSAKDELLDAKRVGPRDAFIFMVGSDLLRKNRANAIRAFDMLRANAAMPLLKLVIAGEQMGGENLALAKESKWSNDILQLGKLDSPTLAAAYSRATVVLFPSLAEGFGLPIIEAQSCGGALVTSNRVPMSEIAADGAVLVDPDDPAAIAAGVQRAIAEGDSLRARGRTNAARFSAEAMRDGYLAVYRELQDAA